MTTTISTSSKNYFNKIQKYLTKQQEPLARAA